MSVHASTPIPTQASMPWPARISSSLLDTPDSACAMFLVAFRPCDHHCADRAAAIDAQGPPPTIFAPPPCTSVCHGTSEACESFSALCDWARQAIACQLAHSLYGPHLTTTGAIAGAADLSHQAPWQDEHRAHDRLTLPPMTRGTWLCAIQGCPPDSLLCALRQPTAYSSSHQANQTISTPPKESDDAMLSLFLRGPPESWVSLSARSNPTCPMRRQSAAIHNAGHARLYAWTQRVAYAVWMSSSTKARMEIANLSRAKRFADSTPLAITAPPTMQTDATLQSSGPLSTQRQHSRQQNSRENTNAPVPPSGSALSSVDGQQSTQTNALVSVAPRSLLHARISRSTLVPKIPASDPPKPTSVPEPAPTSYSVTTPSSTSLSLRANPSSARIAARAARCNPTRSATMSPATPSVAQSIMLSSTRSQAVLGKRGCQDNPRESLQQKQTDAGAHIGTPAPTPFVLCPVKQQPDQSDDNESACGDYAISHLLRSTRIKLEADAPQAPRNDKTSDSSHVARSRFPPSCRSADGDRSPRRSHRHTRSRSRSPRREYSRSRPQNRGSLRSGSPHRTLRVEPSTRDSCHRDARLHNQSRRPTRFYGRNSRHDSSSSNSREQHGINRKRDRDDSSHDQDKRTSGRACARAYHQHEKRPRLDSDRDRCFGDDRVGARGTRSRGENDKRTRTMAPVPERHPCRMLIDYPPPLPWFAHRVEHSGGNNTWVGNYVIATRALSGQRGDVMLTTNVMGAVIMAANAAAGLPLDRHGGGLQMRVDGNLAEGIRNRQPHPLPDEHHANMLTAWFYELQSNAATIIERYRLRDPLCSIITTGLTKENRGVASGAVRLARLPMSSTSTHHAQPQEHTSHPYQSVAAAPADVANAGETATWSFGRYFDLDLNDAAPN